jgi:dihydroxyacetone kinase
MKKLINDVAAVVPEMLAGLAALDQGLAVLPGSNVVVRADAREPAVLQQVALVSGGGAGHEPAHGGYVGPGLLSAAVVGEVFTSPSADAVLEAIRAVAGPSGVLLIVKSYTGDRLNFGLAAELARAEGIAVELVVVADDVALSAGGPHAGRRGLAGTVLVHKVAGAAAAAGRPLGEVAAAARATAAALGTMGVALGACTVPAAGQPGFTLADDEVEWGLGIHGEPGVRRTSMRPADAIAEQLLEPIIADLALTPGSRVALLVNNLGGTAVGELSVMAWSAVRHLRRKGLVVERAWSGAFLTALEMPGCSLSLLALDDARLAALDAPARTGAWPSLPGLVGEAGPAGQEGAARPGPVATEPAAEAATRARASGAADGPDLLRRVVLAVCARLTMAERELTELDARVGDGDLGINLARAAAAVEQELDGLAGAGPAELLRAISATVRRVVGGTSGPLYAVMLLRAAAALDEAGRSTPAAWSAALTGAVAGVRELGGAEVGDRTMVDALQPAAEAFARELAAPGGGDGSASDPGAALAAAARAARAGADATSELTARLGRSSYLGERARGVPDPGAYAVALWLAAIEEEALSSPSDA